MRGRSIEVLVLFATLLTCLLGVPVRASDRLFSIGGKAYAATADEVWQARDQYDRVVVMFHAEWCGACKSLKPSYHSTAASLANDAGVRLLLVDATKELALALQFDVSYYPTVVLIEGDEVWSWKRGTTVTLEKFAKGDFDRSENRFSSWYGPYTRIGRWKYRAGTTAEFVTDTFHHYTDGKSFSYKLAWIMGLCMVLAFMFFIILMGTAYLTSPRLPLQDRHED